MSPRPLALTLLLLCSCSLNVALVHWLWTAAAPQEPCRRAHDAQQPSSSSSSVADTVGTARPTRDLFISYASGYELRVMCGTIRTLLESGFAGDVVLLVGELQGDPRSREQLREWLRPHRQVRVVDAPAGAGPYSDGRHPKEAVTARFFAMYRWLALATPATRRQPCKAGAYWCGADSLEYPYRYVVTADLRDLLFQRDPSAFLEEHLGRSQQRYGQQLELVVADEGYVAGESQWAAGDQARCVPHFYESEGGRTQVYLNAGQLAGTQAAMMSLMRAIYEEQKHAKAGACDQAAMNQIVLADPLLRQRTLFTSACSGWALLSQFRGVPGTKLVHPAPMHGAFPDIWTDCNGEVRNATIIHGAGWSSDEQRLALYDRYNCRF
eukprot:m51a1_g3640 hypothetical protein (381) ;mRNA; r:166609-167751